jgi:hypothetical protein
MTMFESSRGGDAVSVWRPGLLEFSEAMQAPTGWTFDAGGFGAGIDNVHVDVHLSPRFRELTVQVVRNLIAEDLSASAHQAPLQLVSAADLEQFRQRYMRLFESALERDRSALSAELLVLLQLALLRWLLSVAECENQALRQEYQLWLPMLPAQLGAELPFSLLVEHCIGRLPRQTPTPRRASPRSASTWMRAYRRWNALVTALSKWAKRIGHPAWTAFWPIFWCFAVT